MMHNCDATTLFQPQTVSCVCIHNDNLFPKYSGVDPELLLGEGTNLGGRLPNVVVVFSEKPYEIKEILVHGGGRVPGAPP